MNHAELVDETIHVLEQINVEDLPNVKFRLEDGRLLQLDHDKDMVRAARLALGIETLLGVTSQRMRAAVAGLLLARTSEGIAFVGDLGSEDLCLPIWALGAGLLRDSRVQSVFGESHTGDDAGADWSPDIRDDASPRAEQPRLVHVGWEFSDADGGSWQSAPDEESARQRAQEEGGGVRRMYAGEPEPAGTSDAAFVENALAGIVSDTDGGTMRLARVAREAIDARGSHDVMYATVREHEDRGEHGEDDPLLVPTCTGLWIREGDAERHARGDEDARHYVVAVTPRMISSLIGDAPDPLDPDDSSDHDAMGAYRADASFHDEPESGDADYEQPASDDDASERRAVAGDSRTASVTEAASLLRDPPRDPTA